MKQLKILATLAVAASALLALTATASADVATSPTGTVYTSTIKAEAEGHVSYDNPIAKIECASSLQGTITTHGTGKTVGATVTTLTFGSPVGTCTDEWHFTVVSGGTLSFHGVTGTYNSDVFWTGTTLESTRFGITCRYATSNTTIGTLTGGSPATLDISAAIPFHSGSLFCGSGNTAWTGSYKVTSPSSLYFDTT